jgi:hypothetical protein
VDLRADVLAAVKAGEDAYAAQRAGNPGFRYARVDEDSLDTSGVSHESPRRLWACLLLRLGEAELAEKTWAACVPAVPRGQHPMADARYLVPVHP